MVSTNDDLLVNISSLLVNRFVEDNKYRYKIFYAFRLGLACSPIYCAVSCEAFILIAKYFNRCYLKLGEWLEGLPTDDPEMVLKQSMSYYRWSTEYDREWYKVDCFAYFFSMSLGDGRIN